MRYKRQRHLTKLRQTGGFELIDGMVFDENEQPLTKFVAFLIEPSLKVENHAARQVQLVLLPVMDAENQSGEWKIFTLVLFNHDGQVETSVSMGNRALDGQVFSREEALKDSRLSFGLEIGDFIVEKESRIRKFLGCQKAK